MKGSSKTNNNRVVLVYADRGGIVYPQGILHVAAYIRERGFDPYILDTRVEEPTTQHFKDVLAVGISSMTGCQIEESLKVCSLIRAVAPDTKIIWGGIHPTLLPEQTLAHPMVDFVVRGEGEEPMYELLTRLQNGGDDFRDIKGLTYTTLEGEVISTPDRDLLDLDSVPLLPYDLLKMDLYLPTTSYFPYQASRGCPFRCTFCYNRGMNAKWRHRSAERVIDDLKRVHEKYGLDKSIHFLDDNLLTYPKFARTLFETKIREGLQFTWNASATIKGFLRYGREELQLLKRSGLTYLRFGAESGSSKIIEQIRKNFTHEDAYRALEKCKSIDVLGVFNFMVGFPDETPEDRRMTFDFIDDLHRRYDNFRVKTIWRLVIYPGTDVFEQAVKEGFSVPTTLEGWKKYGFTNMPQPPWLSRREFRHLEVINNLTRHPFLEESKWSWQQFRYRPFWTLLDYSSQLRWKHRFFKLPFEWYLRSFVVQRRTGAGTV